ncbi:hypothetical protein R5O87_19680, partial [Arthrobacter globiformis]|uniref:hypothetical protein n=1 Tax=Arthrobacter globiformis TaxID=1665 RepID=UPI00397C997A
PTSTPANNPDKTTTTKHDPAHKTDRAGLALADRPGPGWLIEPGHEERVNGESRALAHKQSRSVRSTCELGLAAEGCPRSW